jgi:molybdate transport system substrate-binding protein
MKASHFSLASALICLAVPGQGNAADISLLSVAAVKEVLDELIPAFEKGSTHKVQVTWTGSADIKKRLAAGESYDLVVTSAQDLDDYSKQGKIVEGSRIDLMKVGVGIAVPADQPKPDVSTTEALKKALLQAKGIGYSTGASGTYIESLFKRIGIADDVKGKLKQTPSGVAVGSILANKEVDIGFQQVSELIHYPGIIFLGPLPPELQNITVYSAGIQSSAKQPEAAKALAVAFSSPTAGPLIKEHGMDPPDLKL